MNAVSIDDFIINNNLNGFHKDAGTDKLSDHSFTNFYEKVLFNENNSPTNILEIGTYKGGWAYAMHKLLPASTVTTIDIENRLSPGLSDIDYSRFNVLTKDAFCKETISFFKENYQPFDIIIDDGPHTVETQLFSIEKYTNLLSDNGVLIIEDIQNQNILRFLYERIPPSFNKKIYDFRQRLPRWDDILIVISKGNVDYDVDYE